MPNAAGPSFGASVSSSTTKSALAGAVTSRMLKVPGGSGLASLPGVQELSRLAWGVSWVRPPWLFDGFAQ